MALRQGGRAPAWASALQMAEAWGMHPADVLARPGGLRWAARFRVYRDELHAAQKKPRKGKSQE